MFIPIADGKYHGRTEEVCYLTTFLMTMSDCDNLPPFFSHTFNEVRYPQIDFGIILHVHVCGLILASALFFQTSSINCFEPVYFF